MKSLSKITTFLSCLCLFSILTTMAGVVNIRVANENFDNNKYCATIQVQSADIAFEIGSATLFFNYNINAVRFPQVNSLNFNESNQCAFDGAIAPYSNSFNFLELNGMGEGNYAILLNIANAGCPTLSNDNWIDVAEFCFDIVNASETPNLHINLQYTQFNTVDNEGTQHDINALVVGVDAPPTAIENIWQLQANFNSNAIALQFLINENNNYTLNLYDVLGRRVYTKEEQYTSGKRQHNIDAGQLAKGCYIVELSNGQQKISTKVIIP